MTDEAKEKAQREEKTSLYPRVGMYRHYKGGTYLVFARSVHEQTLEPLVHYYSYERCTFWTRTREDFLDIVTDADHVTRPRFVFVGEASPSVILRVLGH